MWKKNAFPMFLFVLLLLARFARSAWGHLHVDEAKVDNSQAPIAEEKSTDQPSVVDHNGEQPVESNYQDSKLIEADGINVCNSKEQTTLDNKPEHSSKSVNSPGKRPIESGQDIKVVPKTSEGARTAQEIEASTISEDVKTSEDTLVPNGIAKQNTKDDEKTVGDVNREESTVNQEIAGVSIMPPIPSFDTVEHDKATVTEKRDIDASTTGQPETAQSESTLVLSDPVVEVIASKKHEAAIDKGDTIEDVKNFIKEAADARQAESEEKKEPPEPFIQELMLTYDTVEAAEPSGPTQNVELPTIEIPENADTDPGTTEKTEGGTPQPTGDNVGQELPLVTSDNDTGEPSDADFPSFGEWKAKVLAEEEKTKQEQDTMGNMPGGAVPQKKVAKQNRNNFASRECGAKILAANPEAQNTKGILNGNKDDYMTNPCTAKKWFVLELCEPIQVRTLELASFELFSSPPATFRVSLSDRYPAKEWRVLDTFHPTEERIVQSFPVEDDNFSKYVKVEMMEHFRDEHFCPVTLLRIYGVDLNYMTDDEDSAHSVTTSQDPDTGDLMISSDDEGENPTNLFESAKETVISLVKKVLKVEDKEKNEETLSGDGGQENGTDTDSENTNLTDGFPLPCVPEIKVPVKMPTGAGETDQTESENSSGELRPHAPRPIITVDRDQEFSDRPAKRNDLLVTKLEDHEQLPSHESEIEPLVTLIDWQFYSQTGNKEMAFFCTDCLYELKHNISQTSEGRRICVYFDLLRGSQPYLRSCLQDAYDFTLIKPVRVQDGDKQCEGVKKNLTMLHDLDVEKPDSTVITSDDVLTSEQTKSGSGVPVVIASTSQSDLKVSESTGSAVHGQPVVSQSEMDVSSHDRIPEKTLDKTEEISNPQEASTKMASVIESDFVVAKGEVTHTPENLSSVTRYPQPGSVVIPTVAPTASQDVEANTASIVPEISPGNVTTHIPDNVAKIDRDTHIDTPSKLEPSYESTSLPIIDPEKISVTEILSATTTPELPPITSDNSVVSSSPPGENTEKKQEVYQSEKTQENQNPVEILEHPTKTDSPPVPSEPPPTPTLSAVNQDESTPTETVNIGGQEDKVVEASQTNGNVENEKSGDGESKDKDLNLIRVPVSPHLKRETAMMRLNNRLKVLELNVSLSSRFLEELSKRYRKQSEEMMKLFNKTMVKISDTNKLVEEKDQRSRDQMGVLEARIDNLTSLVHQLADNMDSLNQKMTDRNFTWATMEVLVVMILLMLSWRRNQHSYITPEIQKLIAKMPTMPGHSPLVARRRNSSTATVGHSTPQHNMVKHSSESALDTQTDLHIVELSLPVVRDIKQPEGSKKKKKKKHKNAESKSIGSCVTNISHLGHESLSPAGGAAISTAGLLFGAVPNKGEDENYFENNSGMNDCRRLSNPNVGGLAGKPRSNSHSGPVGKALCPSSKAEVTSNGEKCPLKRVSSDTSTSSVSSGLSDKDLGGEAASVNKRGKATGRPSSGPGHGVRGSKVVGKKGASGHKNVAGVKSCPGQTHTRAQSDGGLSMTGTSPMNFGHLPSTAPPGGSAGRIFSDVANSHEPSNLESQKHRPRNTSPRVETVHANGHSSITSHDLTDTGLTLATDRDKPAKWSSGWRKAFSIK